jgi:AcrR family transcriptional regulator
MPAKYCREQAIHNATQLFWEKGYHATSMRDIQVALDMRPGSIYAEFGNKLGLFSNVVQSYVASSIAQLTEVAHAASPLGALHAFVVHFLTDTQAPIFQRQCLLIRSINELSTLDAQAKNLIIEGLTALEVGFATVLDAAVKRGELPQSLRVEPAAHWFQQQVIGLRTSALLSSDNNQLLDAVEHCFNYLPSFAQANH